MPNTKSSSSNKTKNTTNQFDERVAATDQAIVIQLDEHANLNLENLNDEALGSVLEFTAGALEGGADLIQSELASERALVEQSLDLVRERTGSEDQAVTEKAIKALAIIAVAAGAAWVAPKVFRG